ncbi:MULTISPECIES: anthranilate synthase component I family protein [Microbacterium]|jgi:anthranilate synthase component 1|uniref:anthranilate synthase component I family protein n=1 Tax=Microbacterium TaxID=33882 RepID=UPI0010F8ABD2|nr:anthranilate synthase component I family protein [Microbacterium sp. 4NA327F11]
MGVVSQPDAAAPTAARLFAALRHEPHLFWIDAGTGPDGVDWVGIGSPVSPEEPRSVVVGGRSAGEASPDWVGWWGYDDAARRAGADVPAGGLPDGWLRVETVARIDRRTGSVSLSGPAADRLRVPLANAHPPVAPPLGPAHSRDSPDLYATLVERCREHIRRGDAYQLCLTTSMNVDAAVDPVDAYLRLRRLTGARRGLFVRVGGVALAGGSPETFLEIGGGVVRTSPIKGTRRRADDDVEDAALVAELRESPKERAENVMIVDLMRNDLARICDPATVTVESLLHLESTPTVHQLVSTVAGRLHPGTTLDEVLRATLPAGSMSGAPKLAAIEILGRLEVEPRGAYAGCAGWVAASGTATLGMTIRSLLIERDRVTVGAGGGITWGSTAADEVAEVALKARAPLAAIGATLPPDWAERGPVA